VRLTALGDFEDFGIANTIRFGFGWQLRFGNASKERLLSCSLFHRDDLTIRAGILSMSTTPFRGQQRQHEFSLLDISAGFAPPTA